MTPTEAQDRLAAEIPGFFSILLNFVIRRFSTGGTERESHWMVMADLTERSEVDIIGRSSDLSLAVEQALATVRAKRSENVMSDEELVVM